MKRRLNRPSLQNNRAAKRNRPIQTNLQTSRSLQTGVILALLAATGFSCKAIFAKLAYQHGVDAITLLTLRILFVLVI